MKKVIVFLAGILATGCVVAGVGCASLSEYVTPAVIDPTSVEYVKGVVDVNEFGGYGNLVKARRLAKAVDNAHEMTQFELRTRLEEDDVLYSQVRDVTRTELKAATQREEILFGEQGLVSLGLSMAGFGTLTGLVGLLRRRPGDVAKEEALSLVGSLSTKDKQFAQVVKGVESFIGTYKLKSHEPVMGREVLTELKKALGNQDTDTKEAVRKVVRG